MDFEALQTKHDALRREFDDLVRRVAPVLHEVERRFGPGHDKRAAAEAIEDGNLDKAGEMLGLPRSHGGDEPDESYQRRLAAEVHGAERADAVNPRPADRGGDPPPEGGAPTT